MHEAGVKRSDALSMQINLLFELARKTGYSDHPADRGGPTMCGVTLKTYGAWCKSKKYPTPSKEDLKNISLTHWMSIFRECFYECVLADEIRDRRVAAALVDWVWASGPAIIKRVQRIVGVRPDGVFGPKTIAEINAQDCFDEIMKSRYDFIDEIIRKNPSQEVFRRGWTNRLDSIYAFNFQ